MGRSSAPTALSPASRADTSPTGASHPNRSSNVTASNNPTSTATTQPAAGKNADGNRTHRAGRLTLKRPSLETIRSLLDDEGDRLDASANASCRLTRAIDRIITRNG